MVLFLLPIPQRFQQVFFLDIFASHEVGSGFNQYSLLLLEVPVVQPSQHDPVALPPIPVTPPIPMRFLWGATLHFLH
jgi:hypothetical protein